MKYILASASPRRKELLHMSGIAFTVIPSEADETIRGTIPSEIVMDLSLRKAGSVFKKAASGTQEDITVIGADTIVVYQQEILGKPKDSGDAFDMLSLLADRTHQVYTGVSLISMMDGEKYVTSFFEQTDVTLYPILREDLTAYVATGDSLDKAGGYGIQGRFSIHVKSICGDYNNVVGLPIARLYHELQTINPQK